MAQTKPILTTSLQAHQTVGRTPNQPVPFQVGFEKLRRVHRKNSVAGRILAASWGPQPTSIITDLRSKVVDTIESNSKDLLCVPGSLGSVANLLSWLPAAAARPSDKPKPWAAAAGLHQLLPQPTTAIMSLNEDEEAGPLRLDLSETVGMTNSLLLGPAAPGAHPLGEACPPPGWSDLPGPSSCIHSPR